MNCENTRDSSAPQLAWKEIERERQSEFRVWGHH